MVNAINSYHENAAPGIHGAVVQWCSPTRIWRSRQASQSLFGLSGASPTNLSFVICNLSFLLCGLLT
jgi:hypothetical protein